MICITVANQGSKFGVDYSGVGLGLSTDVFYTSKDFCDVPETNIGVGGSFHAPIGGYYTGNVNDSSDIEAGVGVGVGFKWRFGFQRGMVVASRSQLGRPV